MAGQRISENGKLPRDMDSDDAVADSFMALRTTTG
jgi:hypothetical protein